MNRCGRFNRNLYPKDLLLSVCVCFRGFFLRYCNFRLRKIGSLVSREVCSFPRGIAKKTGCYDRNHDDMALLWESLEALVWARQATSAFKARHVKRSVAAAAAAAAADSGHSLRELPTGIRLGPKTRCPKPKSSFVSSQHSVLSSGSVDSEPTTSCCLPVFVLTHRRSCLLLQTYRRCSRD